MLIIRKCMFVVLAICIMSPLLSKTYALCSRECQHFQYAIAEVPTYNNPTPAKCCLDFYDDNKGGSVYAPYSGLPSQDNREKEDFVAVWPWYWCGSPCFSWSIPSVAGEPYDPEMESPHDYATVYRYTCEHASY